MPYDGRPELHRDYDGPGAAPHGLHQPDIDTYWYVVTGGREYSDTATVHAVMRRLRYDSPGVVGVIEGGARGLDTLVREWCRRNRIPCRTMPADWAMHGRAAGHIRNVAMLDTPGVLLVIAFPGGQGTESCVESAHARNIPVLRVEP